MSKKFGITPTEITVLQNYYNNTITQREIKVLIKYYVKLLAGNPLDGVATKRLAEISELL